MKKLNIVKINADYCDFLRNFDSKVSYNKGQKGNRPFIGVIFKINSFEYFAPLSSPKEKHLKMKNNIDCMKIDKGKLGIVNFNNMIPVFKEYYQTIDLDLIPKKSEEKKYIYLLRHQHKYLTEHIEELQTKSRTLYNLYCNGNINSKLKVRCCNYPLLEEKCLEYKTKLED